MPFTELGKPDRNIHVSGTRIHVDPDIRESDTKHEAWLYDDTRKKPVTEMIGACKEMTV